MSPCCRSAPRADLRQVEGPEGPAAPKNAPTTCSVSWPTAPRATTCTTVGSSSGIWRGSRRTCFRRARPPVDPFRSVPVRLRGRPRPRLSLVGVSRFDSGSDDSQPFLSEAVGIRSSSPPSLIERLSNIGLRSGEEVPTPSPLPPVWPGGISFQHPVLPSRSARPSRKLTRRSSGTCYLCSGGAVSDRRVAEPKNQQCPHPLGPFPYRFPARPSCAPE